MIIHWTPSKDGTWVTLKAETQRGGGIEKQYRHVFTHDLIAALMSNDQGRQRILDAVDTWRWTQVQARIKEAS